jgi:hypothetical protein
MFQPIPICYRSLGNNHLLLYDYYTVVWRLSILGMGGYYPIIRRFRTVLMPRYSKMNLIDKDLVSTDGNPAYSVG